jgi:hypothetical protein
MVLLALSPGTSTKLSCSLGYSFTTAGFLKTEWKIVRILYDKWWIRDFNNFQIVFIHSDKVSSSPSDLVQRSAYSSTESMIDTIFCRQIYERCSQNLRPFNIRYLRSSFCTKWTSPVMIYQWDCNEMGMSMSTLEDFVVIVQCLGTATFVCNWITWMQ